MKISFYYILFFSLALVSLKGQAYILNKNQQGVDARWISGHRTLIFYLNPQNSIGMDEDEITQITQKAAQQWSSKSSVNIEIRQTSNNKIRNGRNDILITDDPLFFSGSGVAGVTQTIAMKDTGEIVEANILINDGNLNFTSSPAQKGSLFYLGNVIAHEFGHALGLDHSQTHRSTMFYELASYQHLLHSDDHAGLQVHYPSSNTSFGEISGTIIGGNDLIPIWGAYVEAISQKTGKAYAGSMTDKNGKFTIKGLDKSDQYFLMIGPTQQLSTLPSYYSGIKSNFCAQSAQYQRAFYRGCYGRQEGHPRQITLSEDAIDVGKVTIRCTIDSPVQYRLAKGRTYRPRFSEFDGENISFSGYFTRSEVEQELVDVIELDLRHLNNVAHKDLRGLFTTHELFSPIMLEVEVLQDGMSLGIFPIELATDSIPRRETGEVTTRAEFKLPLSSNVEENVFTLYLRGRFIKDFVADRDDVFLLDYFPTQEIFQSRQFYYFAQLNLMGGGSHGPGIQGSYRSDNQSCPQAVETYRVTGGPVSSTTNPPSVPSVNAQENSLLACGTIAFINHDPPSGGGLTGALLLIFMFPFILFFPGRKSRFTPDFA